jgi:YHS domain-containing protein
VRTIFLFILAAGLLVGCGEEAPKTPPAPPPTAAQSPAPAVTATATTQPAFSNTLCPVSDEKVGGHGEPTIVMHNGKAYGLCCEDCTDEFNKDPEKYASKAR